MKKALTHMNELRTAFSKIKLCALVPWWLLKNIIQQLVRNLSTLLVALLFQQGTILAQDIHWVDSTLSTMTVEEKVGQLFIADLVAVYSHQESPIRKYASRLLQKYHVGGFVLAGGTVSDIALMTNSLQQESKVPLLINADLEGGLGFGCSWQHVRGRAPELPRYISGGGTRFTSMMAIGATQNPKYAFEIGRITARESRAVGIHWTNAPVADVNTNPDNPIINTRSFGENPQQVAKFVEAYVRGLQDGHMMATLKHFPGHGDTEEDTHMELPVLQFDEQRLMSTELVPFKAGIRADVKAVMTGHIALPKIDRSGRPSTLSRPVVTGILREKLGFQGIVVTDGMTMQGITNDYAANEAAILAIEAGVDCILVPDNFEKAFDGVLGAVKSGRISGQRLDSSVRKVLAAKSWVGIDRNRFVDITRVSHVIGSPESDSIAQSICDHTVTLLRNRGESIPLLRPRKIHIVTLTNDYSSQVGQELQRVLQVHHPLTGLVHLFDGSGHEETQNVLHTLDSSDVVVLAVYLSIGAWQGKLELSARLTDFLRRISKLRKPIITVAFGDPYVIAKLPETDVVMTPYAGHGRAERSVAAALVGDIDITGKLPVTIPGKYAIGEGLDLHAHTTTMDH